MVCVRCCYPSIWNVTCWGIFVSYGQLLSDQASVTIRVNSYIHTCAEYKCQVVIGATSPLPPPPPPDNFRGRQITPTNYLSLQREFIRNSDSFYILEKYFDLVPFRDIVEEHVHFIPWVLSS